MPKKVMASLAQHFGRWRCCFDNGKPATLATFGADARKSALVATWDFMIPDQLKYYIIISFFFKVKVLKIKMPKSQNAQMVETLKHCKAREWLTAALPQQTKLI